MLYVEEFASLDVYSDRGNKAAEDGEFCRAISEFGQAITFAVGVLTHRS